MNQYLEKTSRSPLYLQLMQRIRNDIGAGVYPAGGRIPSEQELCETYGVSRVTVRKAILDLVHEGLLVRRQGKGTFVAGQRLCRDLRSLDSFADACISGGHQPDTRLISAQLIPAAGEDAQLLALPQQAQVLELCLLRLCDSEPVLLETLRFPAAYDYLRDEAADGSLYACLRRRGVIPTSARRALSLGHATPFVGKHLGTDVGHALLLLDETVLDQHGAPLHLSRQWIRGDKYTFRM
jgi:GntR family transcriptional regulator